MYIPQKKHLARRMKFFINLEKKIIAKKINIIADQNRYYDLHYFFNTLIKKGFFPQFIEDDIIPVEAQEFVKRIVPKKYQENTKYVHKRGRILINEEYNTSPVEPEMNDGFSE